MFRVPAPNYTQAPNALFDDWLPLLGMAELKVLMVIMRKTFGWHKIRDRISLSQLETITGLERRHISKAVKGLQEKGLILKIVEGEKGTQNTFYELIVIEDSNISYQCPKDTPGGVLKTPTKETISKEKEEIREEGSGEKGIASPSNPAQDAASADASALAIFFLSKIKENKPDFSKGVTPQWKKDFQNLLKKRSVEQIKKVINFVVGDDFWKSNILCPAKIIKHLDTLELQMNRPGNKLASKETADFVSELKRDYGWDTRLDFFPDGIGFNFNGGRSKIIHFKDPRFRQEVVFNLKNLGFKVPEGL